MIGVLLTCCTSLKIQIIPMFTSTVLAMQISWKTSAKTSCQMTRFMCHPITSLSIQKMKTT